MAAVEHSTLPRAGADIFGDNDRIIACTGAIILTLVISAIDKLTGFDLHLGVLHLIPIAIVTWNAGRIWGMAVAPASITIWLAIFKAHAGSAAYYWDGAILLAVFVAFVELLTRLRDALESSNARFVQVLEEMDGAVYVADPVERTVLYGNRHFREASLDQRSYELLSVYAAKECRMRWPDGRRAILRIITEPAR